MVVERWPASSLELLKSERIQDREQAASTLRHLAATNVEQRKLIVSAGAVPLLVELLTQKDAPRAQEQAAGALRCLAFNNHERQELIVQAGALPLLVQALASEHHGVQHQAASALAQLAASQAPIRQAIVAEGAMPLLVELMRSGTPEILDQAAHALRNLTIACTARQRLLIESNGVPPLVEALHCSGSLAQEHAAGTLKNLVISNDAEQERVIMQAGAVPWLIQVLQAGEHDAKVEAAGVLLRLIDRMVEFLGSDDEASVLQGATALQFLALSGEHARQVILEEGAIPHLARLLKAGGPLIKECAAGTLRNMARGNPDYAKPILQAGASTYLADLLDSGTSTAKENAAGALNSLVCTRNPEYQRRVMQCDPLVLLLKVGQCENSAAQEQAISAVMHLTAISSEFQKAAVEADAIPITVELVKKASPEVQEFAAHTLAHLAEKFEDSVLAALPLPPLKELQTSGDTDAAREAATAALQALGVG